MKREVIGQCPICGDKLDVSRLHCRECHTSIEGSFDLCKFCQLDKEQKEFAEIFIKNRGNIKEIEKELGISYPTVKNRLDSLVSALGYSLGYNNPAPITKIDKMEILQKLDNGEISSEEAIRLMNE